MILLLKCNGAARQRQPTQWHKSYWVIVPVALRMNENKNKQDRYSIFQHRPFSETAMLTERQNSGNRAHTVHMLPLSLSTSSIYSDEKQQTQMAAKNAIRTLC